MKTNYKIFCVLLFIFAVGICAGSFFEAGMAADSKSGFFDALSSFFAETGSDNTVSSASFGQSFFSGVCSFLPALLIGYLSAFLPVLIPLIPLYICTRGISVGFSSSVLLETFGLKGIIYIFITLMPVHLIQLPVFCFLGIISMQTGKKTASFLLGSRQKTYSMRITKKNFVSAIKKYSLLYLAGSVAVIISCMLQAFLLQAGL